MFFGQIHGAGRIALDTEDFEPRERLTRAVAELAKQEGWHELPEDAKAEYLALLAAYKNGVSDEEIDDTLRRIYLLAVSLRAAFRR